LTQIQTKTGMNTERTVNNRIKYVTC